MVLENKLILELKVLYNSLVSLVTSFMDQRKELVWQMEVGREGNQNVKVNYFHNYNGIFVLKSLQKSFNKVIIYLKSINCIYCPHSPKIVF